MQTGTPIHTAILVASVRQNRFAPVVANWFLRQVRQRSDMTFDVLDLAEIRLPDGLADPPPPTVAALSRRLAQADAFVVVTPEYNHSFPASIKNAIDWFGPEWRRKPVAFVSYGGASGGLRAVEHLRLVFGELEAVPIRDSVSFHHAHSEFDADGAPRDSDRAGRSAAKMLHQLVWWAGALRNAREGGPARSAVPALRTA